MYLNPDVWGPHYWHFLHTIAMTYPQTPTEAVKKKYYELLQNFDLFIPINSVGKHYRALLHNYPITPYLDNKESLVRWMHFMHNKINERLEKPQITLHDFYAQYYEQYKSPQTKAKEQLLCKKHIIFAVIVVLILCGIFYGMSGFF